MAPALEDGDYAVAKRLRPGQDIMVGDVVEIRHPDFGPIVKRVRELRSGDLRVQGQARSSVDSDQVGWIARSRVTARLIWRVSPKGLSRIRVRSTSAIADLQGAGTPRSARRKRCQTGPSSSSSERRVAIRVTTASA